jgi:hypothetical protein
MRTRWRTLAGLSECAFNGDECAILCCWQIDSGLRSVGRELYGPPYAAAVDAGVGSVMCSFNREFFRNWRSRVQLLNIPLLPFFRAGINETWSCANEASQIDWLKTDCEVLTRNVRPYPPSPSIPVRRPLMLRSFSAIADGFDGFTCSDWGATHGTADFALGGLDMEQEWVKNATFFGAALAAAVANGTVPQARLDDMARRILTAMSVDRVTPSVLPT